jgi:hypothetical protein
MMHHHVALTRHQALLATHNTGYQQDIVGGKLTPSTKYGGVAGGLKYEDANSTTLFKYANSSATLTNSACLLTRLLVACSCARWPRTSIFADRYALDQQIRPGAWVYGRNHEYAMKVSNHELRSMEALLNCKVAHLLEQCLHDTTHGQYMSGRL